MWGAKTPGRIEPKFCLMVGVHDIITPLKFGDDRFRGFWLAEGQSLHFPIYFVVLTTLTLPCECDSRCRFGLVGNVVVRIDEVYQ